MDWVYDSFGLPDRKSFSIISKELLAGPNVASCLVAFLNLIGNTLIPIAGSTTTADIDSDDFCANLAPETLLIGTKLNPNNVCN